MAGTGGLMEILHDIEPSTLLDKWRDALLPAITDEGFRAYPVYIPLLNAASLLALNETALDTLAGNCAVYLRESTEDKSLLVLSRHNLSEPLALFATSVLG